MSKQQSSSSTPLDPPPVFYIDENLSGKTLADELRRFPRDWSIELHYDHFKRGKTPDPEIIATCGARGWSIISCDDRLRIVPQNIAAVHQYGVRVFTFPSGNYQGAEYRAALITARHRLVKLVRKNVGPLYGRIFIDGGVKLLNEKPVTQLTSREKTALKYGTAVFARERA